MEARQSGRDGARVRATHLRFQSKPVLFALGLIAFLGVVLFVIHSFRHRFVRENHDLLQLLPGGDVTTFYADISALRSAGLLSVLSGSKPTSDAEYKRFVQQTQFDYTKDLEALAGTTAGAQTFFAVRGHFDWKKLEQYASAHGGTCRHDVCHVPASTPERWISFLPVQPDVIAVALSPDDSAAEQLKPDHRQAVEPIPSFQPVWVRVSHSLLKAPLSLPLAVRIFAISLQSADSVIFSLGKSADPSQAAFDVELDAECTNAATAESARNQLEIQTKMLSLELTREHAKPNAADLTGLLTSGAFEVRGKRVVGTWPVRKELLQTLQ